MSQGADTDRIKVDDRVWHVQCANCSKWFYATRSDATYCSPKCRKHASKAPERKANAMVELQLMGRRANQIANTYPHSQDMFDQMVMLKAAIARALDAFEVDWQQQQLPPV
jgi:predicted nucleic acid-binding Zn ribbon protein